MHPVTKLLFNYTKGAQSLLSVISSFSLPNTGKPHTADAAQRKAGKQFRQHRRHAAAKAIRRVASYQEALEIAARMAANEQLSLLARYRPAGEPSASEPDGAISKKGT